MYMGRGAPVHHGHVAEFDRAAGTGTVVGDGVTYPFHCIEIADGSRTIEPGTPVAFGLLAKFGRFQAAQIRPA